MRPNGAVSFFYFVANNSSIELPLDLKFNDNTNYKTIMHIQMFYIMLFQFLELLCTFKMSSLTERQVDWTPLHAGSEIMGLQLPFRLLYSNNRHRLLCSVTALLP